MLLIIVNIEKIFLFVEKSSFVFLYQGSYSFQWFQRLRGIRRSTSHDTLTEQSPG